MVGIATAVDRDRFLGSSLRHGRIASVTVTPRSGGMVTGARIVCGGADVRCARLANPDTTLRLSATPEPGAVLLRWTGACAAAGTSVTCDVPALGDVVAAATFGYPLSVELTGTGGGTVTSLPSGIDCPADCQEMVSAGSNVTLHADADPASVFDGWGGPGAGTDATCTVDVSATDVSATFGSVVSVEEDGAGTGYAWGRTVDDRAIGGSYRWERRAGASTTFAFSGTGVTLLTRSGPGMGEAAVTIDGAVVATIDGYAPTASGSKHRFGALAPGDHELTLTVLGTKGAAARGTRVAVDAIR